MNRRFTGIVVSVISAVCLSGVAMAQSGPAGQNPSGQPAINPPAANPPAVVMGGLSEEALVNAIKALDPNYKMRILKDQNGKEEGKEYTFTVVRDGWSYVIRLSAFAEFMWLDAALGKPVSNGGANVPAAVLAKLLQNNFEDGPVHFAFSTNKEKTQAQLYLSKQLDRRMTIELFNAHLNGFLNIIRKTYPIWSTVGTAA